jgi:hypothetical protein
MNFTRLAKKARVKSRAKTANEDNPFSIYHALDCGIPFKLMHVSFHSQPLIPLTAHSAIPLTEHSAIPLTEHSAIAFTDTQTH